MRRTYLAILMAIVLVVASAAVASAKVAPAATTRSVLGRTVSGTVMSVKGSNNSSATYIRVKVGARQQRDVRVDFRSTGEYAVLWADGTTEATDLQGFIAAIRLGLNSPKTGAPVVKLDCSATNNQLRGGQAEVFVADPRFVEGAQGVLTGTIGKFDMVPTADGQTSYQYTVATAEAGERTFFLIAPLDANAQTFDLRTPSYPDQFLNMTASFFAQTTAGCLSRGNLPTGSFSYEVVGGVLILQGADLLFPQDPCCL